MTAPAGLPHDAALFGVERSLAGRSWRLAEANDRVVGEIVRACGCPDALARLMAARGIDAAAAPGFLTPRMRDSFPDPSSFTDMDKAAGLIWDAIEAGRRVALFADYDVDGASSAAQLARWLRAIDREPLIYIPDRIAEGYGPNAEAFAKLKADGAELVVTLDCGAAAREPLRAAAELGLQVIVVDHHLMEGDLPPAAALINPNRPGDASGCGHLAAAGVTFVLLAAMNREGRRRGAFEGRAEPDILSLSDLAALGTICDVVSLTGFNRALVAQGLRVMSAWARPGLAALAEIAGIEGKATPYHAGFLIGPRINAGGRVGKADLGVRLLSTEDQGEARAIALEPRYIIYDEPTSGLDPQTSNRIDVLIRSLAEQLNATSIVVTHDMHSVLSIADRAAFIHEGRMHWVGSVAEMHESEDAVLLDFVKANEYQIGMPERAA